MRSWARRTTELHDELAAVADVQRRDPRWWLVAGSAAAAEPWPARAGYVVSDAEPAADTFIGYRREAPRDPITDAIIRAHAARAAIRELDGKLPDQPLAVTIHRGERAIPQPNPLACAAFAIGEHCVVATLADHPAREHALVAELVAVTAGREPTPSPGAPFVTVTLGEEPIATARHGHRRGWQASGGPWLGLGRTDELATVSTCHLIVDGYGHAWLTGRIEHHHARLAAETPSRAPSSVPLPSQVADAIPLGIAWRPLDTPSPRAIPLAYALGGVLHRAAGKRDARFSPTFQIPIAPGAPDDPERRLRRVMPAVVSLRFEGGQPEPYALFEARMKHILQREADGHGLCARLIAATRAAPTPLSWKRRGFSTSRPRWLDRVADVLGGRACLSRIRVDAPVPPACAVSSPSRMASASDPLGACVVTVIDDGAQAAITVCGSGLTGTTERAEAVLAELIARV